MTARILATASGLALICAGAAAQDWKSSYTLYGTPGLIEMPTALSMPDGRVAGTLGYFGQQARATLSFQATERLTATVRYARLEDVDPLGGAMTHRGLDLHYRFLDENGWRPAMAIGARDIIGTGPYSSEYLVATKTFGSRLAVTAGLGWGQMGARGGFDNPLSALFGGDFDDRSLYEFGAETDGELSAPQLFQGDAALFAGVEYTLTPSLRIKAEYSSDEYRLRPGGAPLFDQASPYNVGLSWSPSEMVQVGAYYLNGSEVGVGATFVLNPNGPALVPPQGAAPLPVKPRGAVAAATWAPDAGQTAQFGAALATAMQTEGLVLLALEQRGDSLRLRYENTRYRSEAQAMGRLARILTHVAPAPVNTFELELVSAGIPVSNVRLDRAQIEGLENELSAADRLWAATTVSPARGEAGLVAVPDGRDRFSWGIGPYVDYTLSAGDDGIVLQGGLRATARYEITPALIASGALRYRLADNFSDPGTIDPVDGVPVVRRDSGLYGFDDRLALQSLTLAHYGRLGPNVYTRLTAGYLEPMFGGVSAEALWKPATSRLALGAELNYAVKRDPAMDFGFGDYDTVSGHVSAYYQMDNDYIAQLDIGRYLAGDWGATVSLDRQFPNGWRVGGFVTLTDVSFEDYGEGSFSKGVRMTIPMEWLLGKPTRSSQSVAFTRARDGGQRLSVQDRLYPYVAAGHAADLEDNWGRFWQ